MRITAACPVAMRDDANDLAMVLAFGPADANTYGEPSWQDAQGNLYAAASFIAGPNFVPTATSGLQRPSWDQEPYTVNLTGAGRAQAALVFWVANAEESPPQAATDKLTAIAGMEGPEALAAMGLTRVPSEI